MAGTAHVRAVEPSCSSSSIINVSSNGRNGAQAITPLPRKDMGIVAAVLTVSSLYSSALGVLLVYMVQSYNIAEQAYEIGTYTGMLGTASALGHLCTSLLWGYLSDRTGRKPWLIFPEIVVMSTAVVLAFCNSFPLACSTMFVCGLFSSTLVVCKSTISELCDRTNKSLGFGIVSVCFGVGHTLGPLLGGVLANPCADMKDCPSIFRSYPFVAPFLLFALLHLMAALAVCFLKETNPQPRLGFFPKTNGEAIADEAVNRDVLSKIGNAESRCSKSSPSSGGETVRSPENIFGERSKHDYEPASYKSKANDAIEPLLSKPQSTNWIQSWNVMLMAALFAILGFTNMYADPLFSIFVAAPMTNGGLGYNSSTMGIIGAIYGAVVCVYTLYFFPSVTRRFGALLCLQACFLFFIFLWVLTPGLTALDSYPNAQWMAVLIYKTIRSGIGSTGYSCALVLLANAAPPSAIGAVIGFSATLGAIIGGPAPAVAGWLWSYFSNPTLTVPLKVFVPWIVPSITCLGGFIISLLITPDRNLRK